MDAAQLQGFVEVARQGSFTRAARALFLSQPALSARIHTLEREVGETLFHRMGRGVRLTEAGRSFLPYAERVLESLRQGQEALTASHSAWAGKLHLATARVIGTYVLPGILQRLRERYPGIDVTIRTGRSYQVLESVVAEEVQVGLGRTLLHPEVDSVRLYDEEIVLVTHPSHPFALRREATIYEVGQEPLILYDRDSSYFVLIDRVCREGDILPKVIMNLDSIEATKRMIELGLGVSFLPKHSIARELELGTLAEVRLAGGHEVKLPTSVMVHKAKSYLPAVLAFLEVLQELFEVSIPMLARSG
ncbi:MAG: LysR family transcriptional regulator [Chloroflexi bacterium]|nr:LysR family transcriptional regulator [Chloroflexota bacterium]